MSEVLVPSLSVADPVAAAPVMSHLRILSFAASHALSASVSVTDCMAASVSSIVGSTWPYLSAR